MTKRKRTVPIGDELTRSTPRRPSRPFFLRWWEKNRSRSLIDLRWDSQDRKRIDFSFERIHPALRGSLSDHDVSVAVEHGEVNWDLIFDVNVKPKRVRGGYICESCEMKPSHVFSDRAALLAHHLCEPFLEWVNGKLAKAHWLVLSDIPERVTMAAITIERPAAKHDPSSEWVTYVYSLRSPFNASNIP